MRAFYRVLRPVRPVVEGHARFVEGERGGDGQERATVGVQPCRRGAGEGIARDGEQGGHAQQFGPITTGSQPQATPGSPTTRTRRPRATLSATNNPRLRDSPYTTISTHPRNSPYTAINAHPSDSPRSTHRTHHTHHTHHRNSPLPTANTRTHTRTHTHPRTIQKATHTAPHSPPDTPTAPHAPTPRRREAKPVSASYCSASADEEPSSGSLK